MRRTQLTRLSFMGLHFRGAPASRLVIAFSDSGPFPGNAGFGLDNIEFVAVPEPSSAIAMATGGLAVAAFLRRLIRRMESTA